MRIFSLITGMAILFLTSCKLIDPGKILPPTVEIEATIEASYELPVNVYQQANTAVDWGARAIAYSAQVNGGKLVSEGTLVVDPNGNPQSYQPSPTDRLRVLGIDGKTYEFIYSRIEGDLSGDVSKFLDHNHNFQFRLLVAGETDVALISIHDNGARILEVKGVFTYEGEQYDADLRMEGTYFFDVDNTGSSLKTNAVYKGTISGQGIEENVDESWQYESVYATGAFVAENAIRRFSTAWEVDGVRYKYISGRIQSVFRDGKPTEWDVNNTPWAAEGKLSRDGQPYGKLEIGQEGDEIKIWLNIGDEKVETQSWRLN